MEKKYMKPEIEAMEVVEDQQILASSVDVLLDETTQDNENALIRMLDFVE